MTNASGNIVESYDYKVYGERTASSSGLTDVGYTGQRHDYETGLMYFKNRYYSVERGSFVTMDPKKYIDGMSMYLGYFGSYGRDPMGLEITVVIDSSKAEEAVDEFAEVKVPWRKELEIRIKGWNDAMDILEGALDRPNNSANAKFTLNGKEMDKEIIRRRIKNSRAHPLIVLPATKKLDGSDSVKKLNEILAKVRAERDAYTKANPKEELGVDYLLFETHAMENNLYPGWQLLNIGGFGHLFFEYKDKGIHEKFKTLLKSNKVEFTLGSCYLNQIVINNLSKDWNTVIGGSSGARHELLVGVTLAGDVFADEKVSSVVHSKKKGVVSVKNSKIDITLVPLTNQNEFISK